MTHDPSSTRHAPTRATAPRPTPILRSWRSVSGSGRRSTEGTPRRSRDRVAAELRAVLETEDLLADAHRVTRDDWYNKHVLYACPEHRFTLLALVWKPGQGTVIHGHTAWGAVGVYEGHAQRRGVPLPGAGRRPARGRARQGHSAAIRATWRRSGPGLADVHRIYYDSDELVITLHTYGCDLVDDPDAINLDLDL